MNAIRSILAIVDPSRTEAQQAAARKAARLAVALGANLELLACDTQATAALRHAQRLQSMAVCELGEWLEGLARSIAPELKERGLDLTTALICGDPLHEQLLGWIGKSTADLIIKDTHHHTLARRTFIGNTDWHLVRDCSRPLLLAKATPWNDKPRLGAAIDPRDPCDDAPLEHRILECTSLLAAALGGQVRIVHAYLPALLLASGSAVGAVSSLSAQVLTAEEGVQRARIRTLLERYGWGDLELEIEMGAPVEILPRYAEEHLIDIFVMGATSRSHLKQALIGSTAERVLERLPCDVLVVKPPRFGDSLPF